MKPGRKRLRLCILYKNTVMSPFIDEAAFEESRGEFHALQRWNAWEIRAWEEDFCWKSMLTLGMWGSKGTGGHLYDMVEGLGAFMHAKDEVWSHQRAQGLGRLEASDINWGRVQQGGFYEGVVYTVCFNLNPSELDPHPFQCVDWERTSSKAVT